MQSIFHAAREYLTPTLKESAFLTSGMLTPEEFVSAGDYLIRVAPSWQWKAGDEKQKRPYLPAGKQYLFTSRVPCYRRVQALADSAGGGGGGDDTSAGEGWVAPAAVAFGAAESGDYESMHHAVEAVVPASPPHAVSGPGSSAAVGGGGVTAPAPVPVAVVAASGGDDEDDYADMSAYVGPSLLVVADPSAAVPITHARSGSTASGGVGGGSGSHAHVGVGASEATGSANVLKVRTYDLSITYDNYYRCPRIYLKGFTEDGEPLSPEEMLSDVMQDYVQRTATIESHPGDPSAGPHISIHPCRHAHAMKRILDGLASEGSASLPPVDHYLFIFLKFIASMIPTIEYDYTVSIKVAGGSGGGKASAEVPGESSALHSR